MANATAASVNGGFGNIAAGPFSAIGGQCDQVLLLECSFAP